MQSPTFYRRRASLWRQWIEANPDAKPNHVTMAKKLARLYEDIIPEAEEAFARLQAIPVEMAICEMPGCTNTYPARRGRRTCGRQCTAALKALQASETPLESRRRRANPRGGTRPRHVRKAA